jgi:wyosine [tRNA(Phe)-imidazoG37] synthetase (radical SAM superfamily)
MNGKEHFKYLFGPVPSRRLGRSLGVDLVPLKACTLDCIYCQVGATTDKRIEREEFVPLEEVLTELRRWVSEGRSADYVTVSGSGEPTLYSRLGELILGVKEITDIPVAVITNGTTFVDPVVRADCAFADLVVPSLDAGDPRMFVRVNRPHESLDFDAIVEGLVRFRQEYRGQIWLEVFLIAGINALEPDVKRIAEIARRIHPDKVQLNTVARPPAERFAVAVAREKLEEFCDLFTPRAEIIASYGEGHRQSAGTAHKDEVLAMIRRHPCTADDVASGLRIHRNEALKYLQELLQEGALQTELRDNRLYYKST